MTSVSMIVEKPRIGLEPGLGRELLVKRGRARRAELALRAGGAGIALFVVVSFVLLMMWADEAIGSILVLGVLVLPVAGWAAHWGSARDVVEIAIYELGVVRRERSGSTAFMWSQISEVFESAHESSDLFGQHLDGSFTFAAYDGRRLVIDSGVPGWREAGRLASAMAQDAMSYAYELGFVAQRPLRFGDLVVDGYGVHTNEGVFPWAAVTFVRLDRRGRDAAFCVHVGAWAVASRIPSDRIANARALVMILDRLGKLDGPGHAVLAELANVVEAA